MYSRCGLEVDDLILEQWHRVAVLDDDEKELGVCLVDIGGGTSDIAVFTRGGQTYAVLPIAGDQITKMCCSPSDPTRPPKRSRKICLCNGTAGPEGELIDTPSVGDRAPRKLALSQLVDV
ncbi:MAG: hypothetical protein Ct9H300mP14_06440 [Gammaproteobacteria bacterium]|nr:MAG: hypothetical protein Ct9H300mP14_06440 [Gammaproteobacteria bacterium]